jgi:hypothetical protein
MLHYFLWFASIVASLFCPAALREAPTMLGRETAEWAEPPGVRPLQTDYG